MTQSHLVGCAVELGADVVDGTPVSEVEVVERDVDVAENDVVWLVGGVEFVPQFTPCTQHNGA